MRCPSAPSKPRAASSHCGLLCKIHALLLTILKNKSRNRKCLRHVCGYSGITLSKALVWISSTSIFATRMDDLRDYSEDGVYPEMHSPRRSFQALPTCTKLKQVRMIGKMKRSRWLFSILKYTCNISKRFPNASHTWRVKFLNLWRQICDYYVGYHRRPSSEKAEPEIVFCFFCTI